MSGIHFRTVTGRLLDLTALTVDDVDPYAIAWSLSMLCRYGGHMPEGDKTIYNVRLTDMGVNAVLRIERRGNAGVLHKQGIPSGWDAKRVYPIVAQKLEYWHG